jgi:hypothetical protein
MATATEHDNGLITRPQVTSIGAVAEQQRAVAEIQAALTVAKHCRRVEQESVDRIMVSCQRIGLAEKSEYVYNRGGTDITGPTIDLLTVIANCWGNIQFGFRELAQRPPRHPGEAGESEVEAFAWDLETNSKRCVTFTVQHKRVTDKGRKVTMLTDPRDIYELVANNAQRRVRACLEAIIPPDIVEDAVMQCRATLKETAQVTPESIAKLVDAFEKLGVTKQQIETKLGRRLDTMQPAQLVNMRRIYKSISDGISQPGDWFAVEEESEAPKSATTSVKEALRKKAAKAESAPDATPVGAKEIHSPGDPKYTEWRQYFAAAKSELEIDALLKTTQPWDEPDDQETAELLAQEARQRIRGNGPSKQKAML